MPRTAAAQVQPQRSLIEWLSVQLDTKLATFSTDQERYRHLILLGNAWRLKYETFCCFGTPPFNVPHPVYGDMDAFDFTLLLADIEVRKCKLERASVPA